jgi:branched-chain amino acid transport system substrate-binding protein
MFAAIVAGCGDDSSTEQSNASGGAAAVDAVSVGVSIPLSGQVEALGVDAKRGIELAKETAERDVLPGTKLTVDIRDDAFEKQQTVVNFQRFLKEKHSAIVGPLGSLIANAALPLSQQRKIPAITMSAPDNGLTKIGDQVFASLPFMAESGPPALLAGLDKAGIAYQRPVFLTSQNYESGAIFIDALKQLLAGKNIEPVHSSTFTEEDKDFAAQVALVKDADPDAVFVSGGLPATGLLVKQLKAAGIEAAIIGDVGESTPPFVSSAGSAKDGVVALVYWDPTNPDATATGRKFVEDYRARYKAEPSQYSAIAFDSLLAVAYAVKQAKSSDPTAISKALTNLQPFEGVTGPALTFGKQRTLTATAVPVVWKGDKLAVLGTAE